MQRFDFTKLEEGDQITDDCGTMFFTRAEGHDCTKCAISKYYLDYPDAICYMTCKGGIWKEVNNADI